MNATTPAKEKGKGKGKKGKDAVNGEASPENNQNHKAGVPPSVSI